jgi:glycerol-3-phosphate dehydrogenase (NAD(P)+)
MNKKRIVSVLGAGNMGTAIAKVLSENENTVYLWNWEGDKEPIEQIIESRVNKKYLPEIELNNNIIPTLDIKSAVEFSEIVYFIVPSGHIRRIAEQAKEYLKENAILVDVSKGLDPETKEIIPEVLKQVTDGKYPVVGISGPGIAKQIARGGFTAMDIAGDEKSLLHVRQSFENEYMKLIPSQDIFGVELGGSFKNVYAILLGVCDGLGYDLNLKSALLTRALAEITLLGKALGADEKTFYSLAGLGDLIGTALSPDSRNRRFGECIGRGMNCKDAFDHVEQVVEGVEAVKTMQMLAKKQDISLPLVELVFDIVEKGNPKEKIEEYLKNF